MIVWICTDMEGLAGVETWDQCYDPDDNAPGYRYACEQLTADTNAAIAGCFDAGATRVRILDGHGRNRNRGFTARLDPRAEKIWLLQTNPLRWEGLDKTVHAVAMVGQHAMAGTLNGFLDHTQIPKELCRFTINGEEGGEMSQLALYAGAYGVPLAYVSGDEALCAEARRLFPGAVSTPTKRGTGWDTCELYAPEMVRRQIRDDIARALDAVDQSSACRPNSPIEISAEWAWSGAADRMAHLPGVRRTHPRVVEWTIQDARDIYTWPNANWYPAL
ncbi:MAG: D-aminopeptidase [Chthonomonadaceae bacterium]|nr:D-aminopeptidase [Chthonomonadaceae bacterium]